MTVKISGIEINIGKYNNIHISAGTRTRMSVLEFDSPKQLQWF